MRALLPAVAAMAAELVEIIAADAKWQSGPARRAYDHALTHEILALQKISSVPPFSY